jgi:hypothetical protein
LPLDEKVLNKALMLLNLTMSEQLIKKWISKVRPQLECEQPDRIRFEKTVKEIQKKFYKTTPDQDDDDNTISKDKMFPHEFMFLLENAQDRQQVLKEVKRQKLSIVKIDIGTHDGIENYDGPKLDKLYDYDPDQRKIR